MRKKIRKMNEKIQNGKFYRKPGLVFTKAPSNGLIISVGIFYVWRMQTCLSWSFWVVGKQRHHHDFSWLLLLYKVNRAGLFNFERKCYSTWQLCHFSYQRSHSHSCFPNCFCTKLLLILSVSLMVSASSSSFTTKDKT